MAVCLLTEPQKNLDFKTCFGTIILHPTAQIRAFLKELTLILKRRIAK